MGLVQGGVSNRVFLKTLQAGQLRRILGREASCLKSTEAHELVSDLLDISLAVTGQILPSYTMFIPYSNIP